MMYLELVREIGFEPTAFLMYGILSPGTFSSLSTPAYGAPKRT